MWIKRTPEPSECKKSRVLDESRKCAPLSPELTILNTCVSLRALSLDSSLLWIWTSARWEGKKAAPLEFITFVFCLAEDQKVMKSLSEMSAFSSALCWLRSVWRIIRADEIWFRSPDCFFLVDFLKDSNNNMDENQQEDQNRRQQELRTMKWIFRAWSLLVMAPDLSVAVILT